VRLMTIVAALAGAVALLADWARRGMMWGRGPRRGDDRRSGAAGVVFFVVWIVAILLAPLVGQMLAMMVSRRREFLADATGAELTRNPLGLARALVTDPAVLLMDEPFGALDNITRSKIQVEFKALDELKRKTIIMVTHDVQEAFELGDRICLMDKGKIVQNGTPAELLFKPANNFVKDFLKEQRLQLEFKAIKVKDIISPPPSADGGTFELNGDILPGDASLWFMLERLKFSKAESISVRNAHHKEVGKLDFEDLMSAFYQYKKQQAHE